MFEEVSLAAALVWQISSAAVELSSVAFCVTVARAACVY
jgi:hypothetical protein